MAILGAPSPSTENAAEATALSTDTWTARPGPAERVYPANPMRIDQIDLRIVRLPLVRPFQTSSSRKDHLDHILVRVVADGVDGWGECASPSDPYYCPETTETCWHILRDFLAPLVLGRDWSTIDELVGVLSAGQGEPLRPGGPRDGLLGRAGPLAGPAACTRCSAARAPRSSPGSAWGSKPRSSRCSTRSQRYLEEGYRRDQAEDRAGLGCRRRPAGPRAVSDDSAAGRRQLGLHARRPARRSRRSTTSTCS